MLIASSVGRLPEEAEVLARLSLRFGLPVVAHTPRFACLASDHPLHHGFDPAPYLDDADPIVVIESDVPWLPSIKAPRATARIAHIGEDPAYLGYPMRGFASHLSIAASAGVALSALEAAMQRREDRLGASPARRAWAQARAQAFRLQARSRVCADAAHISPEYLSQCIAEVAGPDGLIINEYQLRLEHCARLRPGTYFALSPAGGLGWSVGAALGARLAAPGRLVVAAIGDGGFIFANPTACHWAAAAHALPILIVIFNNGRYGAVRNATLAMFPSGAARTDNSGPALWDLTPRPPFEAIARAHGAFARRVEQAEDLRGALAAAREAVLQEKRHALVDVITPY